MRSKIIDLIGIIIIIILFIIGINESNAGEEHYEWDVCYPMANQNISWD